MPRMITILGPTACGKTSLAVALALKTGGEILSADSRQVYRRMDIGTGKDLDDYTVGEQHVDYHLIDICEPGTKYNLFQFQHDFFVAYNKILDAGHQPIMCGGSGLYIESVIKGYNLSPVPPDEELRRSLESKSLDELKPMLEELKQKNGTTMHNKTDVDSVQRAIRAIEIEQYNLKHPTPDRECPPIDTLVIGIDVDRDQRRQAITRRLKERLQHGMIEEIEGLLKSGISPESLMYYGLEYKYVTEYVTGIIGYDEMFRSLEIAIHQFAKRQMTWFRGMERRGTKINWISYNQPTEIKIDQILELWH